MKTEIIQTLSEEFQSHAYSFEEIECWDARDLQRLLGYARWENFAKVIGTAKVACKTTGLEVDNHFRDITKMVDTGSEAKRPVDDLRLTRYACYLIAQNGDPAKQEIAFAQSYFAVQTRKREILEDRINQLERLQAREKLSETERRFSGILYERGVDDKGFAAIRSSGDQALFGGRTTGEMKQKLGVPNKRPLADFLPTLIIKAKDFAAEITTFKVREHDTLTGQQESKRNTRKTTAMFVEY